MRTGPARIALLTVVSLFVPGVPFAAAPQPARAHGILGNLSDELPRLGPSDRLAGGTAVVLAGLSTAADHQSDLGLVNLTRARSVCSVSFHSDNGADLGPAIRVTLRAQESRPWVDVFAGAGSRSGDAQATVSCSGDFYAYGLVTARASGRLDLVSPAPAGTAATSEVAETSIACPESADCFDAPGIDHIPQPPPGAAVGRVAFPVPGGVATRFVLSLDVTVADWYARNPSGKHLIYWFVVTKNVDMPGMLYFLGPSKNQAFVRHGMGITHPEKIKIIKSFAATVGHTYHVVNDYDMAGHRYTVTITDADSGQALVLAGKPNVASYTFKPKQKQFFVDMGFPEVKDNPTEVPSYGWTYANVHVEAYGHR